MPAPHPHFFVAGAAVQVNPILALFQLAYYPLPSQKLDGPFQCNRVAIDDADFSTFFWYRVYKSGFD